MIRRLVLALAALGAACSTIPRAPDEGGPTWFRVESPHFVVESDLKEKEAVELTVSLERWRVAMAAALFAGAREPRSRLHVVAVRGGEIQAAEARIEGFYSDHDFVGPSLLLGGKLGTDPDRIIKHELAHALIHENIPRPPQWLNEGMAVFLETTTLDDDGTVEWGARDGHVFSFQGLTVSNLEALFDPRPWPAKDVADAEFIAGRLIRMLVHKHPAELARYLERLRAFDDPRAALDACFLLRPAWASEISADGWARAPAVGRARIALPEVETRVAKMSDADVHATLALVDFNLANTMASSDAARAARLSAAGRHLERALALDPNQPLAAVIVSRDDRQDLRRRLALTAALMSAHPNDWRGWALRSTLAGLAPLEARDAARRAFALEPHRAEVLFPLAGFAAGEENWKAAAAFAREAALLQPESVQSRALWFIALERLSACDDAARVTRYGATTVRAALVPTLRAAYVKLELGTPRCPLP